MTKEFIGHRCWVRHRGVLCSPYSTTIWPNDEITAQVRGFVGADFEITVLRDLGPLGGGVYAYKTYEDLRSNVFEPRKLSWLATKQWPYPGDTLEVGTCWLWGTVVEHGNGWRAQHAAVKEINEVRYWPDFHRARLLPDFGPN
jgi:hypothetical protein